MSDAPTPAIYYDGRSSRAHRVRLTLSSQTLRIGGDVEREVPMHDLRVGERLGSAPRRIDLRDGAYCEVEAGALESLLARAGMHDGRVDRLQRSWLVALVAVMLVAALIYSGWRWGVPAAAGVIARWMSPIVAQELSEQALAQLDGHFLKPSKLPEERQARLRARAGDLRGGDPGIESRLLFRSSGMPPNAFALPDGTIVLLDSLVEAADSDDQVLAVIAHELGHVEARHGLRLLVQTSIVGGFLALWVGDVSSLLAAAPAAVLHARYSRGFEDEADRYAAELLHARGLSPALLADILEKLGRGQPEGSSFLASHPAPAERISRLRRQ